MSLDEGDFVSYDGGHSWFVLGTKEILAWEDDTSKAASSLRRYADQDQFWPNAWLISDHGNVEPFRYHI